MIYTLFSMIRKSKYMCIQILQYKDKLSSSCMIIVTRPRQFVSLSVCLLPVTPRRRTQIKNVRKETQVRMKNIKNGISKISETQKWPQNPPKTKISKNSKSHVRRTQIKNFRKLTIVKIEKYYEWYFWKFWKLKITPKTHKNLKLKKKYM